jgi:hypothetical protein
MHEKYRLGYPRKGILCGLSQNCESYIGNQGLKLEPMRPDTGLNSFQKQRNVRSVTSWANRTFLFTSNSVIFVTLHEVETIWQGIAIDL